MSEFSNYNDQFPDPLKMNWKTVFYTGNKNWANGLLEAANVGKLAGFKYFVWHDSVYLTESVKQTYVRVINDEKFVWDKDSIEEFYIGKKVAKMNRQMFSSGKNMAIVEKITTSYQGLTLENPILFLHDCPGEGEYARECYRI